MKMSDVFELPVDSVDVASGAYNMIKENNDGVTPYDMAALAINTHDRMKELLQQAAGRVVISQASTEELEWLADTIDVLDGDI